ncbi:hypothetical protein GB931_21015 [Modestobacter sp. I12A-02628]|uniref:Transcriptional regulator n=1 Tax=Goekera deserti TaxID=2497753 RepID=A0A7K3WFL9_9ACTN|nr:YqgE/AlgH family protein [Goekera deserti]MPR00355.1 hypothetical protein [Goekera deserti]NDI50442.1 hypothetical protein [Goekera deserti]NEL55291.1 hypothetical protein [Goekera deserti]
MNAVPSSPDPESRPPVRPVAGARRRGVPGLSIGSVTDVVPGSLLVAMPALDDENFAGAVVYVLDHGDTGTLGVVLGQPSEVQIRDVLPGWSDLAVEPGVFHVGGPCEADTALCLAVSGPPARRPARSATDEEDDDGLRSVAAGVHLVDLDADPGALAGRLTGLRVFAGYAGWSRGQLAVEMGQGSWACVPGSPDDVLSSRAGADLWRAVLRRQRGPLAVLATAPTDPSEN